jgi:acetyl esterase
VRLRRVRRHEGASVPPDQRAAVADVRDTRIATPAGPLPVRIYRPLSPAAPLPTIVWYHGGGWTTGSLETGDIVARALSSGTPAVVVSVAYRLGPEHPWPAATDDATAALQWAAAHIGELGGDPERIAVGGDSAGGNLAAVAVIAVAEYDPLRDQGTGYAKTLRAVSVPVTVHPGPGLIHGCFDMLGVTAAARDEIDRVLRSIREALAVTSTDDACPGRSQ